MTRTFDKTVKWSTSDATISTVSASGVVTIALTIGGELWIWGANTFGQIGDGGISSERSTPYRLLTGVSAIAAGGHFVVIYKTNGEFWTWGRNSYGQLGDGTMQNRNNPVKITF